LAIDTPPGLREAGTTHTPTRTIGSGPVEPLTDSVARRPFPIGAVRLSGGLVGELQRSNGATSIREGDTHLGDEGAWVNFENAAAGRVGSEYFGPVFEDGEVYKWLEAVAWEFARSGDAELDGWLSRYTELIASAQSDDGYLNTFFTASGKRNERYESLDFDHEIFNMGAMIQAAVAQYRATGREAFLEVARRAADHLDSTFGPGKREGTCGHPVVEMALAELYRTTEEPRYLELARYFVDIRGKRTLHNEHFGPGYFSDRVSVRETISPEGHAVRAVYLAAGATDVAIETGDRELLATLERQWDAMVAQKMYVTGGLGSRWEGESFGDPYELPSDRAYAETCAAIASMQWSWRLFLAIGDAKYGDLIERQFYNAVLSGVSLERDAYFYVNALQVRSGAVVDDPGQRNPAHGRQHWFGCSCCPTNLMRTVGSVHHYLASRSAGAVQINQYASALLDYDDLMLEIVTEYPWDGRVEFTVRRAPDAPVALELRVPSWAVGASVSVGGESTTAQAGGYHRIERDWSDGDIVVLNLPMTPRLTKGHPRVDDVRGSVAIERGPIVYAVEQVDLPDSVRVDDIALTGGRLSDEFRRELLGGVAVVHFEGMAVRGDRESAEAFSPAGAALDYGETMGLTAIPYFLWANRGVGAMKVWIPERG
jgi:DUF1680 family protein